MPPQSDPNDITLHDTQPAPSSNQSTVAAKGNIVGSMLGGRYLIEQELARGGMGVVYLARDKPELLSRRVVVKVLLEDSLKDEWVVKKFRQEIESLTRLDHPGVVGIVDAGTLEDGSPYLVMQYVEGTNLRAALKPEGMELERAANIIKQIGRTLTVAHDQGIVHRDLKPENIMLRSDSGGEDHVKIIDFGIAKVKNSAIAPTTLTGMGTAGTVAYMSPEQLTAKVIAAASDIYALGVISYELVAGRRPFNPETSFQLSEMQKAGVQVPLKALRPAIPEAAEKLILKSLSYRPQDRPQRAKDFGDALALALTEDDFSITAVDAESEKSTVLKPQPREGRIGPRVPAWIIAGLVLLAAGIVVAVIWIRSGSENAGQSNAAGSNVTTPIEAKRELTYSLTVQRTDQNGKSIGASYESTGQEGFGKGWKFRVNITPAQSGALYMLSEFKTEKGPAHYDVLFPTNGVAELAANQKWQAGENVFEQEGTVKFWIIWSARPLRELEVIFKDVAKHEGQDYMVISNPKQVNTVRSILDLYNSSRPEMETNPANTQTTLRGKGEVLVSLLELKAL